MQSGRGEEGDPDREGVPEREGDPERDRDPERDGDQKGPGKAAAGHRLPGAAQGLLF